MPLILSPPPSPAQVSSALHRGVLRPLHLWHLLSLDAPSVATLWTAFVASATAMHLPAVSLVAMFLTVWTLYGADRLLDAQPLHNQPTATGDLEHRHLFHHRHRRFFLVALGLAVATLATLIPQLAPAALHLFLVLGTFLAGYFILIHATSGARRLPKEIAVGLFFSAAIFIPTVARLPFAPTAQRHIPDLIIQLPRTTADPRLPLAGLALLFAALCCLNCLCIYAWEHPSPAAAAPHVLTAAAIRHRSLLATILLLASVLGAFTSPFPVIPFAIALSALALLLLEYQQNHLHPLTLRAAADLALTSPLLFLPHLLLARSVHH